LVWWTQPSTVLRDFAHDDGGVAGVADRGGLDVNIGSALDENAAASREFKREAADDNVLRVAEVEQRCLDE
jgi:hypothetical protein